MSTIITSYQIYLIMVLESRKHNFIKNVIAEYLCNIFEAGYVVLKLNKDIMISFSKLDEVATLDTSSHKREKNGWRPSTI